MAPRVGKRVGNTEPRKLRITSVVRLFSSCHKRLTSVPGVLVRPVESDRIRLEFKLAEACYKHSWQDYDPKARPVHVTQQYAVE